MPRLLLVTIDLERVRENLSREDARPATQADVVSLLVRSGFRRWGSEWLAPEGELSVLRQDEVVAVRDVPADPELSRLILSGDYETHLDLLENRRRIRTAASRRRSILDTLSSMAASFARAAGIVRRR